VRASVVGAWLMGGIDPCSSSRVGHCRSLVSSWRTNPTSTLVFAFLANSLPVPGNDSPSKSDNNKVMCPRCSRSSSDWLSRCPRRRRQQLSSGSREKGRFVRCCVGPNDVGLPARTDVVGHGTLGCSRSSVIGAVAGWGLVRTHAADAARVLPSPPTPRPLGAPLLSSEASPDPEMLGATASRSPETGGGAHAVR
jgi:hypothetical protein